MTDKIAIDRSVVEQALEALETGIQYDYRGNPYSDNDAARCGAYDALRAALEQPQVEQEPVAWIEHEWSGSGLRHLTFDEPPTTPSVRDEVVKPVWTPLYTHPQPPRQPLTDEAEHQCPYPKANPSTRNAWLDGWEAAERAHGIGGKE